MYVHKHTLTYIVEDAAVSITINMQQGIAPTCEVQLCEGGVLQESVCQCRDTLVADSIACNHERPRSGLAPQGTMGVRHDIHHSAASFSRARKAQQGRARAPRGYPPSRSSSFTQGFVISASAMRWAPWSPMPLTDAAQRQNNQRMHNCNNLQHVLHRYCRERQTIGRLGF